MPNVIRCMHGGHLRGLKSGTPSPETIGVYYGFNNYSRNIQQLMTLVNVIKAEVPGITEKDMEVYEITPAQSDRHAHHTMIFLYVPTDLVRKNLDNYITL